MEEEKKQKSSLVNQGIVKQLADEVAQLVIARLPKFSPQKKKRKKQKIKKDLFNSIFLDTSAIIDGRIFEIMRLGLFSQRFIILDSVLLELKHIADSQNTVKRERGRQGLEALERVRKELKMIKLTTAAVNLFSTAETKKEVDEQLIFAAHQSKGKIITCDYNLEKKASIHGVMVINMHALANCLKINAVPGEALHVHILHHGKEENQGIAYLDDGTMIVVENSDQEIGRTVDVVVSRVIQTASGKILFAKKI